MNTELRDVIRQVKESADIVEIVGRTVTLKKSGASFKGTCPFHKEKTPSFHVIPAKGIFHCFGCGVGGGPIDFVMKAERLEFMEALEKLAGELGIAVPKARAVSRDEGDAEARLRASILEANQAAFEFFRRALLEGKNSLASDYLPRRGLSPDLCDRFGIGASLDSWDALKLHLQKQGFSEALLLEAKLCAKSEKGRVFDMFRNRLMFPIRDVNGRVVGFGGRQLVDAKDGMKYINSPNNALYNKGQNLYALDLARPAIEKQGYAILCEGYMDVVTAHARGYPVAVASLGTALTQPQARLLHRFAHRLYFLYDGDAAGQKAMLGSGAPLMEAGFDARVISLPPEDDPDTFLRREGERALDPYIEKATEYFDFAIETTSRKVDVTSLAGQAEMVDALAPLLEATKNEIVREGAIGRILRRLGGLPRDAIASLLARRRAAAFRRAEGAREDAPDDAPTVRALDALERSLLKLMYESVEALDHARTHLRPEWLTDSALGPWILFLHDGEGFPADLLAGAEASGELPGDRGILAGALALDLAASKEPVRDAEQLLARLHERYRRRLAQQYTALADRRLLPEDEARQILAAIQHEHEERLRAVGRFSRTTNPDKPPR